MNNIILFLAPSTNQYQTVPDFFKMLKFSQLRDITGGELLSLTTDNPVVHLITDSRKAMAYDGSVFFAVYGLHHDGHQYIKSLYDVGIRQFVIEKPLLTQEFKGANFLKVNSSIKALQQIAAHHRAE